MQILKSRDLPNLMLLCMDKKYVKSFIEDGKIHFSCAKLWSNYQENDKKNTLQGDILEGIIACTDKEKAVEYPNIEYYKTDGEDGKVYIKSKRSMHLPAYCFYGLSVSDKENSSNALHTISDEYMEGFLKSESKTRGVLLESKEFLCIPSFEVFYSRLLRSLHQVGVCEKDILLYKLNYSDDKEKLGYTFGASMPKELFEKSAKYCVQCEYRIILNDDNLLISDESLEKGYEITISPLENVKRVGFECMPTFSPSISSSFDCDLMIKPNLEQRCPADFLERLLKDSRVRKYYTTEGDEFTFELKEQDKSGILAGGIILFMGLYDCIAIYVNNTKIIDKGLDSRKEPFVKSVFYNDILKP